MACRLMKRIASSTAVAMTPRRQACWCGDLLERGGGRGAEAPDAGPGVLPCVLRFGGGGVGPRAGPAVDGPQPQPPPAPRPDPHPRPVSLQEFYAPENAAQLAKELMPHG